MARFGKPPGEGTLGFDQQAGLQVTHVGASTPLALFDGDSLAVAVANTSIATLSETPTGQGGLRAFILTAASPGTTTVDARDAGGAVQASLELQVNTERTLAEALADFQITDEDRANLSPADIKNLEDAVRDMRFNPLPEVEMKSERFEMDSLVKAGERFPPDWKRKG
ncbi:MAG: hypothetical protein ACRENE_23470 [Polyangiaceae bacterium]